MAVCALSFGLRTVIQSLIRHYRALCISQFQQCPNPWGITHFRICSRLDSRGGTLEISVFLGRNIKIFSEQPKNICGSISLSSNHSYYHKLGYCARMETELQGILLACFCHQYSYFIHEKLRASSKIPSGVLHKYNVHQFKLPQECRIFYLKLN